MAKQRKPPIIALALFVVVMVGFCGLYLFWTIGSFATIGTCGGEPMTESQWCAHIGKTRTQVIEAGTVGPEGTTSRSTYMKERGWAVAGSIGCAGATVFLAIMTAWMAYKVFLPARTQARLRIHYRSRRRAGVGMIPRLHRLLWGTASADTRDDPPT